MVQTSNKTDACCGGAIMPKECWSIGVPEYWEKKFVSIPDHIGIK